MISPYLRSQLRPMMEIMRGWFSSLVLFLSGTAVGWGLSGQPFPWVIQRRPAEILAKSTQSPLPASASAETGDAEKTTHKRTVIVVRPSQEPEVRQLEASPQEPPSAQSDSTSPAEANLLFNESVLQRLESDWENLPRYAVARATQQGWKIELKDDDQVFGQVGLRQGDVISYQSLRNEVRGEREAQLAVRVSHILRHIEQP